MSVPRILFVIHDVYQEDNFFPSGIGYLAAIARDKGCSVDVYAMDVFHYTNDQLAEYLDDREYDLVCLGFMAARFRETVVPLIKTIHEHKKSAWLVLGGHGPSPIPEYMLGTTSADIVVIGEAENTLQELIDCRISAGALDEVRGIAFRDGNDVRVNPRNNPVRNLDSIPFPAWEFFPMEQYTTCLKFPGMRPGDKAFPILSSRGCSNRCNFCYRMEKGIRARSVGNVVQEMRFLHDNYGITYFFFVDELFIFSKKRVIDFARELKQSGLKVLMAVESRVDVFDEEIADILKDIGCVFINIGFESTSQKVLDTINKNVTVEQNIRAAEIAKNKGIGLGLNSLWGEPGDDEETLKNNAAFIMKHNLYDQVRTIRPVTPYPGCDLYYYAIESGLLAGPEDFFSRFVNSDLITVNFTGIPDKLCYEMLLEINSTLVRDHFEHTSGDMEAAERLIEKFRQLYAGEITNFRGVRADTSLDHKRDLVVKNI